MRTFLNRSGIEVDLTEFGVVVEGSHIGFIKDKFYNSCQRIKELAVIVLKWFLLERFSSTLWNEEKHTLLLISQKAPSALGNTDGIEESEEFITLCGKYNAKFEDSLNGLFGKTVQYWTIYIFLINRVYGDLRRCVRTNDINGYIDILLSTLNIFFPWIGQIIVVMVPYSCINCKMPELRSQIFLKVEHFLNFERW